MVARMASSQPLSDAQAQRLIRLYDGAEKEILTEINRLLLKDPASESYSMAWQKTLLQRVRQIRADLEKGSRTWCSEAIPESYMKGMEWADKDPLMSGKAIPGFGSIHQQAAQVLAENTYNRLQDVGQVVGRKVDDLARAISLEASKGSVLGYQTTKQAAKRIKADLAEKGITAFRDKAGREWDMGRYARVLAQETTNGAFRQGSINRYQEHGHDLVRISHHAGSCKQCQPYQGQTFSLTGEDKEFPALSSAKGLFHVGCLHVISLAPEEKDRFIGRLQGKEGADVRAAEIKRLAEKAGWKEAQAVNIKPPLRDIVNFVPAKSIKEAEDRIKQFIGSDGIEWEKSEYAKLNDNTKLHLLNNLDNAIFDIKTRYPNADLSKIKKVTFWDRNGGRAEALDTDDAGNILTWNINLPNTPIKTIATRKSDGVFMAGQKAEKWGVWDTEGNDIKEVIEKKFRAATSANNEKELVIHEIGHVIINPAIKDYVKLNKAYDDWATKSDDLFSAYGASHYSEGMAEAFVESTRGTYTKGMLPEILENPYLKCLDDMK